MHACTSKHVPHGTAEGIAHTRLQITFLLHMYATERPELTELQSG